MVTIFILLIIYLSFISLGLPDSILGAALPSMLGEMELPLSYGGLIASIIIGCFIASSFASGFVIKKLGTGKTVFISGLMTGLALLGISLAPSYWVLILLSIPLGLGGGSVDTALNNYVASHFKAHHMNWLHSFWGVGATLGPIIMSVALSGNGSWRAGYGTIGLIQLSIVSILLFSLPLWKRADKNFARKNQSEVPKNSQDTKMNIWKIYGVIPTLCVMALYCTIEAGIGLWGSSFLVEVRQMDVDKAASMLAFYFGGITAGRFLSGFLSFKFSNTQLIRFGIAAILTGISVLIFAHNSMIAGIAIIIIGLGLAPVYPAMIHETPDRFGRDRSQIIIGFQMGFGGLGSAVLSPIIGFLLQITQVALLPVFMLVIAILLLFFSERANTVHRRPVNLIM